jgi:hypothetical protein
MVRPQEQTMTITRKQLADTISFDDLQHNKKEGTWTFRRGFFYRSGYTAEKYKENIAGQLQMTNLPFTVIECGEVWKAFKGGASTRAQSHWYVTVRFTETASTKE